MQNGSAEEEEGGLNVQIIGPWAIPGQAPDSQGGRDFKNFKGGEYFFEKFLEGDRFFTLKGGGDPKGGDKP